MRPARPGAGERRTGRGQRRTKEVIAAVPIAEVAAEQAREHGLEIAGREVRGRSDAAGALVPAASASVSPQVAAAFEFREEVQRGDARRPKKFREAPPGRRRERLSEKVPEIVVD